MANLGRIHRPVGGGCHYNEIRRLFVGVNLPCSAVDFGLSVQACWIHRCCSDSLVIGTLSCFDSLHEGSSP
jgi:hypothetical protein